MIAGATVPAARNWGARLRETAFFGIPALTLENEVVRVTVLPYPWFWQPMEQT